MEIINFHQKKKRKPKFPEVQQHVFHFKYKTSKQQLNEINLKENKKKINNISPKIKLDNTKINENKIKKENDKMDIDIIPKQTNSISINNIFENNLVTDEINFKISNFYKENNNYNFQFNNVNNIQPILPTNYPDSFFIKNLPPLKNIFSF
jgi:hypothetical protein